MRGAAAHPFKLKVYLAGFTMSTIFGLSFMFTKNALDRVEAFQFLGYRFSLSFLFMLFLYLVKLVKFEKGKNYAKLIPLVIFQPVLYFSFETLGLQRVPSSEGGIIIASIPVMTAFLTPLFMKERVHLLQYLFVFASLLGVILMMGMSALEGDVLGDMLLFAAVLTAVSYSFISRKLSREFKPQEITFFMMLGGCIVFNLIPICRGSWNLRDLLIPPVFVSVLYLGVLSSAVAFFLVNYMLGKVTAVQASIFSNLTTVVAVLAGVFLREEKLFWYHFVGMGLILMSSWGVNYIGFIEERQPGS